MARITIRIPDELDGEIKQYSSSIARNYSDTCRSLLEEGLARSSAKRTIASEEKILSRILKSAVFTEQIIMRIFDPKKAVDFDEEKLKSLDEIVKKVEEICEETTSQNRE